MDRDFCGFSFAGSLCGSDSGDLERGVSPLPVEYSPLLLAPGHLTGTHLSRGTSPVSSPLIRAVSDSTKLALSRGASPGSSPLMRGISDSLRLMPPLCLGRGPAHHIPVLPPRPSSRTQCETHAPILQATPTRESTVQTIAVTINTQGLTQTSARAGRKRRRRRRRHRAHAQELTPEPDGKVKPRTAKNSVGNLSPLSVSPGDSCDDLPLVSPAALSSLLPTPEPALLSTVPTAATEHARNKTKLRATARPFVPST